MKAKLCLDRCRNVHFSRHLHFFLTFIRHQLQEPRTLEQIYRKIPFKIDLEKELSNPVPLHHISMGGQRGSDNLDSLLRFKFAERQILTCQELKGFQRRHHLQPLKILSFHDHFLHLELAAFQSIAKSLHRNLKRIELYFKSGSDKQLNERNQRAAIDVERTHRDRG